MRDAVWDLLRGELARSNAALASDANTDPLTGQPNKRAFDIFVEEARAASAREGKPLSLLMLDVDHFKRINDTRGHGTGDVVLQTLARRWSRELRSSDMLARLGGEEFCVVLPRTGAEAARRAGRIRLPTQAKRYSIWRRSALRSRSVESRSLRKMRDHECNKRCLAEATL